MTAERYKLLESLQKNSTDIPNLLTNKRLTGDLRGLSGFIAIYCLCFFKKLRNLLKFKEL
jgi:hypothetical protein